MSDKNLTLVRTDEFGNREFRGDTGDLVLITANGQETVISAASPPLSAAYSFPSGSPMFAPDITKTVLIRPSGRAYPFSVHWQSEVQEGRFIETLEQYPQSYRQMLLHHSEFAFFGSGNRCFYEQSAAHQTLANHPNGIVDLPQLAGKDYPFILVARTPQVVNAINSLWLDYELPT